jgi:hypothetical protein
MILTASFFPYTVYDIDREFSPYTEYDFDRQFFPIDQNKFIIVYSVNQF